MNEINYYIDLSINENLGYRKLEERIKNKEYERLDDNTKLKLMNNKEVTIIDEVKEPIIISNPDNIKIYKEYTLQKLILENYQDFLKELGNGYSLVGNEYKIEGGYIDLLLYNIKYKCYVVVELKIGRLKKSYISQVEYYMNYIDKNVKEINDNKTIGIILCHKNNKLVMEFCSNPDIIIREYLLI